MTPLSTPDIVPTTEFSKPFPISDFIKQISPRPDESFFTTQDEMLRAITTAEGGLGVKIAPQITPDFTAPDRDGNSPLQALSEYFKEFNPRNTDQKPIRDAAHRFMLNVSELIQNEGIDVATLSQVAPGQMLATKLFPHGPNDTSAQLMRNIKGLFTQENIEATFGEKSIANHHIGLIRTALFRTAFATLGHIPFQAGMLRGVAQVDKNQNPFNQPGSTSEFARNQAVTLFVAEVVNPLIGRKV